MASTDSWHISVRGLLCCGHWINDCYVYSAGHQPRARHSVQHSSSSDNIRLLPCSGRSQATVRHSADTLHYSILSASSVFGPYAILDTVVCFLKALFHALENWTDTKAILQSKNGPPMILVEHMLQMLFNP